MNLNAESCPRCGTKGNLKNRIITDSCGHIKCKQCFLAEVDECIECKKCTQETKNMIAICTIDNDNINIFQGKTKCNKDTICEHITKIAKIDGTLLYRCTVCQKNFKCRTQQYYHIACGSSAERKYKCEKCEKSFATRSHLNYHNESHVISVNQCTQCHKTFRNRMVLKKHERLHKKETIPCMECGKLFRNKDTLRNHLPLHKSKHLLQYSCKICNKRYATKSTLQQHMLKHLAKQHECHMCAKRFQRNSTLQVHLKKHTNTECFVCTTCRQNFSDAAALMRHTNRHKESTKYRCLQCDITSIRKDNMLRHVRNIHKNEIFGDCIEILNPSFPTTTELDISSKTTATRVNIKPKTIENSSVIKCIGNVEPVKIPTITNNSNSNEQALNKEHFVSEIQQSCSQQHTIKTTTNKTKKEPYDPIEMYRRILTLDDDDDNDEDNNGFSINDVNKNKKTSIEEIRTISAPQTRPICMSNFSEMHWRKNFVNSYEFDVEKCYENTNYLK